MKGGNIKAGSHDAPCRVCRSNFPLYLLSDEGILLSIFCDCLILFAVAATQARIEISMRLRTGECC